MQLLKKPYDPIALPKPLYIVKDPCGANPQNSGVYSKVDVGNVIRQADSPQFVDDSILTVARDENITRYGTRSFIPKVTKEFRPPLRDPIVDYYPLSRLPVKTAEGRINRRVPVDPQNQRNLDVRKYIDETRRKASVRPTYVIPLACDVEAPIVKDLHRNTRATSARAGEKRVMLSHESHDLSLDRRNPIVEGDAGLVSSLRCTPLSDDIELERTNRITSVHAGFEVPVSIIDTSGNIVELERTNPLVSASAGMASRSELAENTYSVPDLDRNNPAVSLSSGVEADYRYNPLPDELSLERNAPIAEVNVNPEVRYRSVNEGEYVERPRAERDDVQYSVTPDYSVRVYSHVEDPHIKPVTRTYNPGDYGAGAAIPRGIYDMTRSLRPRNMRCTA